MLGHVQLALGERLADKVLTVTSASSDGRQVSTCVSHGFEIPLPAIEPIRNGVLERERLRVFRQDGREKP